MNNGQMKDVYPYCFGKDEEFMNNLLETTCKQCGFKIDCRIATSRANGKRPGREAKGK